MTEIELQNNNDSQKITINTNKSNKSNNNEPTKIIENSNNNLGSNTNPIPY